MTSGWPLTGIGLRLRQVGGIALAEAGATTGEPLLFLHGIGSAGCAFDAQLAYFARERWCIAPDAPGYAASDDDPAIRSMDDLADRWVRLLDELSVRRAILIGVSWGGVAAARVAARHPRRVAALVLADSSRGSGRTPTSAAAMRSRLDDLSRDGVGAFSAARAPRLVSPRAPAALVERVAHTMERAVRMPGYGQAVEMMATTDNTEALRAITAPTLVLVGALDVVTPPTEAAALADLIAGARFCPIADAGHLANQEQPEVFNQAVGDFLATTFPAGNQPVSRRHDPERTY